ncbi:MAG: universal stress protein [Synechococcaceae cyanobacterium]|nr:universal stress protein [Synechococcaceae cyanobacterium]
MGSYTHLLVPSDGSVLSTKALHEAVKLARCSGARITLVHAQPRVPLPVVGMGDMLDANTMEALIAASRRESDRLLEEARTITAGADIPFSCERVESDLPHRVILETAERLGCDLIVMGSHGRRGLQGLLLGSETQRVLLSAPCPVLVVR